MRKFLASTLAVVLTVMSFVSTSYAQDSSQPPPFSDIQKSYAKDAILELQSKGILEGIGNGQFNPSGNLTRAQYVVLLVRVLGIQVDPTAASPFTDVPEWARAFVAAAYKAGIINGVSDTQFGSDQVLTREAAVTMEVRGLEFKGVIPKKERLLNFTDSDLISDWAKDAIAAAVEFGLVSGFPDGSFNPWGSATREMAAVMCHNLLVTVETVIGHSPKPTASATPTPTPTPTPIVIGGSGSSGGGSNPTPTITPSATPTPSPTVTPTPTPTPTVTPSPTASASTTPSPSVTPTPTPSPVGIKNVLIWNSSIDLTSAKVGDVVKLQFVTDEQVFKLGNFKINGSNPDSFNSRPDGHGGYVNWASYMIQDSDPEGPMTFQINVKNAAGIYSQTVEQTTDGSSVTVVKAPKISNVHLTSSNTDPKKAYNGDIVTLTFETARQVWKLSNFKINGSNPDTFTSIQEGHIWKNTATLLVGAYDPAGPMTFQINVKDAFGLYSITTETTSDGSSVDVVQSWKVPPVAISNVHLASSNVDPMFAKKGDTVTLTFQTAEEVFKLGNFKINGGNPKSFDSTVTGSVYTNTAAYVVDETDPEGFVSFQVNVKNADGNYSVTTGRTTDGSSVEVLKAPVVNNVHLTSSNADPTKAYNGDTVTLTFETERQSRKLGNFKITGSNPDSFTSVQSGGKWLNTAKLLVGASDPEGPMTFQINVKNGAGLYSITTEATTDGSSVEVVKSWKETPVAVSNVHLSSSNGNPAFAKPGDTVTLTFETVEKVFNLGNFKINGGNPTDFESAGSGSNWTNTATYIVDETDPAGPMNFQINVKNDAGIYSKTVEATYDGSSVTVQKAPAISSVHLESTNTGPVIFNGDTIILTFETQDQVWKLGNFKINGSNPDTFESAKSGDHWKNTATLLVGASDPEGLVKFQINVKNAAGLYSITTEQTTDGSSVYVSRSWQNPPVAVSSVTLASSNADPMSARDGDTVTLSFQTTEEVTKLSNFKINGGNPTYFESAAGPGGMWNNTATYTVDASDPEGPVTFQINVKSKATGRYSTTVEATTDGSLVEVERTAPMISNVHLGARFGEIWNGDTVTLTFDTNQQAFKLSNFKINGSNPNSFASVKSGGHWANTATYLIGAFDPEGPINFQINVKNGIGLYSITTEQTTDGSSVSVKQGWQNPPVSIWRAKMTTSNPTAGQAFLGDTVTVSFETEEPVEKLSNFKINGSNPDTFVETVNGSFYHYEATHLVDTGDKLGPMTFQINVKSKATGLYSTTVEGGGVTVVKKQVGADLVPTGLSGIHGGKVYEQYQLNYNGTIIPLSSDSVNRIAVTLGTPVPHTTDLTPDSDPTLWFNVQNIAEEYHYLVFSKDGYTIYDAVIRWPGGEQDTAVLTQPLHTTTYDGKTFDDYRLIRPDNTEVNLDSFDAMYEFKANGEVVQLTPNGDGTNVLWFSETKLPGTYTYLVKNGSVWTQASITVAPFQVSNVSFKSSNTDPAKAVMGDSLTLTFDTPEKAIKSGSFKINGSNPDSFDSVQNGDHWTTTATHLVDSGDQMGAVGFQINVQNDRGFYSQTVEATNDGSAVEIVPEFASGNGTMDSPYIITSALHLDSVRRHLAKDTYFRLESDINLGGIYSVDSGWTPIGEVTSNYFLGNFDGNNHVISNLKIVREMSGVGLFSSVGNGGSVHDIWVEGFYTRGYKNVGSLVGVVFSGGSVSNAKARSGIAYGFVRSGQPSGSTDGSYVGGLVGFNYGGSVSNSTASNVTAAGHSRVGGLVGRNWGSIGHSKVTSSTVNGDFEVGGLVGENHKGASVTAMIAISSADAVVTGTQARDSRTGGLAGDNDAGVIQDSYAVGEAHGTDYVGGLTGSNNGGTIERSYAANTVTHDSGATYVGGVTGQNVLSGIVTASFYDSDLSGLSDASNGTPKTTTEMKTAQTFLNAGWETLQWNLQNGLYPTLN